MNSVGKLVVKTGLLSLLSVMPLAAQIDNGVDFTTSFPFYAGDSKLPAGQYKVSQPDANVDLLQVESIDGKHSVFVQFVSTQSAQPHRQSDIAFQKYGDTDYLNRVWIEGSESDKRLSLERSKLRRPPMQLLRSIRRLPQNNRTPRSSAALSYPEEPKELIFLISAGPVDLCVG